MLKDVLIGLLSGLLFFGVLVLAGKRRGWLRNGYFSIPSTVLLVLGIWLLFQTVGGVLAVAVGGIDPTSYGLPVLAMNGVAQLVVMLLGTVVLSRGFRQNPFSVFRLEGFGQTPFLAYLLAFPIIFSAQILGIALSSLWIRVLQFLPTIYSSLDKIESAGDKQLEGLVTAHNIPEFIAIFILVTLVPAFAEETLFRGFAQSNIERSGHRSTRPYIAILVTAILFASIHLSVFKLPGLACLGLSLGWMAYRTNNLFVGSLGHAANNGLIVIALYLSPKLGVDASDSALVGNATLGTTDALLMVLKSLPILVIFLYLFHRVTANIPARTYPEDEFLETIHSQNGNSNFLAPLSSEEKDDFHANDQSSNDTKFDK